MIEGIYEELVTELIKSKLESVDSETFHIKETKVDKEEAALLFSKHIANSIRLAFQSIKGSDQIDRQIEISNKIIRLLRDELDNTSFDEDLIATEGKMLHAVFSKIDSHFSDLDLHLKEITPYTRLTHSELFTGANAGVSLGSELQKEILSADRIDLLVSFIKFKGIIILEPQFKEFIDRGGELRVITTTYMGASDYKAIQLLSNLPNTTVKISYNTGNERLHAKAYLFYRKTGFHTAYIGSSNFSRSALTDGLEWNLKVTTKEVGHIIDKFQKTFETYWQSNDFEIFNDGIHRERLIKELKSGKFRKESNAFTTFFDLKPYPYQNEILEKLEVERGVHNRYKNLIVAATGTGKTVISAFDFKNFKKENPSAKLLFLAHRKEILEKSMSTFQGVLKDNNFGELWVDGMVPDRFENVFASVQTLNNKVEKLDQSPSYYDFIIIDECHHLTANSYRGIIEYFNPKILLGLTATPERMDGGDIQEDFHNRIAAEIRLPEALNRKLLSPFQYFGISDSVDLSKARWERGRYVPSELTKIYTKSDRRVGEIIQSLEKYTKDINEVKTLGFCVSIEHAQFMAHKFTLAGLKADYLTSSNSKNRDTIRKSLMDGTINYLFVVDIFNEGVDIPEIDTVLFLRPTESLTIFLQQLGRGLRLADNKECLTVLDFVGNVRPEYNFENKFRALIGKTNTPIKKEVEDSFPHLPLGCSIVLEKKAKESILKNIRNATSLSSSQLINKIKTFKHQTSLPLTLSNFLSIYSIKLQNIYKRNSWNRLCQLAGEEVDYSSEGEKAMVSMILRKWLASNSLSYFKFILNLARNNFQVKTRTFSEEERLMLLMLHYDYYGEAGGSENLETSITSIGRNRTVVQEIVEVLEILIDRIDFKELEVDLPFKQPLKVHARYTRDQILVAFRKSSFSKKSSNREGSAVNKDLNTELLFINLIKSEENFSPTTMYDDYAVTKNLFHWQSQNSASPETAKGLSYINQDKNDKIVLLFVREKAKDEFGNTMGYVFIGKAFIQDYSGAKPMNINWKLEEPMPNYLWKESAKLAI
ncbi:DUF3427 domain-containing protein [Luteirhabdus pelagi]|uniref:DUF3427 domain-containing protein n=1 Tax=Luteirhabdus pelagi TaxID=2792783 RepID=UPI0019394F36|nr:DEAD/DEAH box helicase [Luteirhabdus pelagi]